MATDLIMTRQRFLEDSRFAGPYLHGYVQKISLIPFTVMNVTDQQLGIFHRLQKLEIVNIIHIDSTGK
jgi:hypothetical protein